MASSSYCYRLVSKYSQEIDSLKRTMRKNLNDMDLENAAVIAELDDAVTQMEHICDSLKSSINRYSFE